MAPVRLKDLRPAVFAGSGAGVLSVVLRSWVSRKRTAHGREEDDLAVLMERGFSGLTEELHRVTSLPGLEEQCASPLPAAAD
jgi:hypothetical protein